MAKAAMETSAERYRRIKREKAEKETLHDVPCEDCGMVWKARRLPVDFWVASGIMPLHLAEMFLAKRDAEAGGAAEAMSPNEVMQSIAFSSRVVMHTAAQPKIVAEAKGPDEIEQEEVELCCYNRLRDWQMSGGDEAERLGNFPAKR